MSMKRRYDLAVSLGLALFAFGLLAPCNIAQDVPAQPSQSVRFAVAHEHFSSWCLGYLYLDADSIWYEVVQPAKDKKHEFKIKRSELLAVGRWIFVNQPKNAVELRFGKSVYHFWWLPDEQQIQTGRRYQSDPPDAANPDQLIAAIRDPASVLNPGATPQAQPVPAAAAANAATNPPAGGHIGIGITDLTPPQIQTLGTNGALVMQLEPDGPAAQAGVRVNDVVTAINGTPVSNAADVRAGVSQLAPGSTAQLQVRRAGQPVTLKVFVALGSPAGPANSVAAASVGLPLQPSLAGQPASSAAGPDPWAPDGQVGDLQFNVPDGWKQMQTREGTRMVPNGLAQNAVVVIGVLPTETLGGDPYSWFRVTWAKWKTQMNLIDSGDPENKHNPNGFDVLRSYSRAYSQRLGNATFILAAAVSGNRVAPYFYLCNSNCGYGEYQDGFQDFELSLTLASLGSSMTNTSGPGSPGGLQGLYVTFRASEGDVATGTFKIRGSIAYLAFFPDGNVIRNLPKEGLQNLDFRAAIRKSRESCGRYRLDGNTVNITWGDNSTMTGVRDGTKMRFGNDMLPYQPAAHSDGLRLNGTYRPERGDPRSYLRFSPDGHFAESGVLPAVDFAAPPGSGSYDIKDNTLTLSYGDGRSVKISFLVFADEEGSRQPATIRLNNYALLRGN